MKLNTWLSQGYFRKNLFSVSNFISRQLSLVESFSDWVVLFGILIMQTKSFIFTGLQTNYIIYTHEFAQWICIVRISDDSSSANSCSNRYENYSLLLSLLLLLLFIKNVSNQHHQNWRNCAHQLYNKQRKWGMHLDDRKIWMRTNGGARHNMLRTSDINRKCALRFGKLSYIVWSLSSSYSQGVNTVFLSSL